MEPDVNSCEYGDVSACACIADAEFRRPHARARLGQADDARTDRTGQMLAVLEDAALEVARAEASKTLAMDLRRYTSRARVERVWSRCCGRMIQRRVETIMKVTGMTGAHRGRLMNAVACDATVDIRAASLESRIRWIRVKACVYLHRDRFCTGICFRLGVLGLYSESLELAHTNS